MINGWYASDSQRLKQGAQVNWLDWTENPGSGVTSKVVGDSSKARSVRSSCTRRGSRPSFRFSLDIRWASSVQSCSIVRSGFSFSVVRFPSGGRSLPRVRNFKYKVPIMDECTMVGRAQLTCFPILCDILVPHLTEKRNLLELNRITRATIPAFCDLDYMSQEL